LAADSTLIAGEQRGLMVQTLKEAESAWPADKPRLQAGKWTCWKASEKEWSLRLMPRSAQAPTRSLHVALAEHSALVLDAQHWTHQATYWIRHENANDLTFQLPAGARISML